MRVRFVDGDNLGELLNVLAQVCDATELSADEYVENVARLIALERQAKEQLQDPNNFEFKLVSLMGMMAVMVEPRVEPALKQEIKVIKHKLDAHSDNAKATLPANENVRKAVNAYGLFGANGVLSAADANRNQAIQEIEAELAAQEERRRLGEEQAEVESSPAMRQSM